MKTNQAFLNGTHLGQLSADGELIIFYWGNKVATGIKPKILRKTVICERNVFSSIRKNAVEIKAARHCKLARNGETLIVTLIGDRALVEINTAKPRVVSIPEARGIWKAA